MVQMDTDEADGQKLGTASSSDEESSSGGARSENPELQARVLVELQVEVGGGQSLYGGVHSVANETLLTSRAPFTSSSIHSSNYRDSTLDHLSRSQFHDTWSRSSKASASAARDVASYQSVRAAFLGRDASLNLSRGAALRDFEDPPLTSSPRHLYQESSRDVPSIGSRPVALYADILKGLLRTVCMPDLLIRGLPPPSSDGPLCQMNRRTTARWPWPWMTTSSRSYWTLSRHRNLVRN